MRVTLLTLAILVGMETDLQVLLLFLALLPAAGALAFVCLLLAARPSKPLPVWQEGERHLDPRPARQRPAHRRSSPRPEPGRHQPGRGRFEGVARQTQLGESTVSVSREWLLSAQSGDLTAWATVPHEHQPYRDGVRIRCRVCKLDVPRPPDMPEVGRGGTWSWDGSTRLGPRPERPRTPPAAPPPASGRGA